jgi:hypothetical protein
MGVRQIEPLMSEYVYKNIFKFILLRGGTYGI